MAKYQVTIERSGFTKTLTFMGEEFHITYSKDTGKRFERDAPPLPAQVQTRFPHIPPYHTYSLIHDLSSKKLSTSDRIKIIKALTEYEQEQLKPILN